MTWPVFLVSVFVVLVLLSQIRMGGGVKYSIDGLNVRLRIGAFQFQAYPMKKAKKEKTVKSKQEKQEEAVQERGGTLKLVKRSLLLACEAAGELKQKIQIDQLELCFIAASADAAGAAMAFGYANMALGMLWPVFELNFLVKEYSLQTSVDFDSDKPTIYINAAVSLKLGQLVSFGLRYGFKLIKVYLNTKSVRRKPVKNQKEAT